MAEALRAREAFLTAASAFVLPVVEIDGMAIRPGHRACRAAFAISISRRRGTLNV